MSDATAALLEPRTTGMRIASDYWFASMIDAGRGHELKTTSPGRPLNLPPIRRKKKRSTLAGYRREWNSLPAQRQRNQNGFESFVARREAGLVAADGTPTQRR